jgi:hypothetical protein
VTRVKILVSAIGVTVFIALVVLAWSGYVHPAMLIDLANIRICS